jgi:hypothetical protein
MLLSLANFQCFYDGCIIENMSGSRFDDHINTQIVSVKSSKNLDLIAFKARTIMSCALISRRSGTRLRGARYYHAH